MSELQWLVDSLQETDGALEHLEETIRQSPDDEILRLNVASVAKRQKDLVRRLDSLLNVSQTDIVRYRIQSTTGAYPAKAVAAAMSTFQELVTAVFDAIHTHQTKKRYRPAADSVELSTLEFAGAGPGSVVVSLSALNDKLLVGDSELDETLGLVERTLSARESSDLQLLAEKVGISAITKAYAWAEASTSYGLNTTIRWGGRLDALNDLTITFDDAAIIKSLIEDKSDETITPVTMDGILHGFDGAASYFHIETFGDKLDIRGDVDPSLSKSWTTGKPYRVRLSKKVRLTYATGQEHTDWTLMGLEAVPSLE